MRRLMILVILVIAVTFSHFGVGDVRAATTINVPADQPTIQDAIDAAVPGDTIIVAAGNYPESLTIDKQITLQGAGSGSTTIDATALTTGIRLTSGGTSASQRLTISGFTIQNSPADGIRVENGAVFNFDHVTFDDLVITSNGSRGIEIHNGTIATDVEVTNSSFVGNTRQGIRSASNVIVDGMTIADSTFDGNQYGIYIQGTINGLTIQRSEFINSVGGYGGYMTETGPLTNFIVEDSKFNNNVVGLMVFNVRDNADIRITGSTFDDNDKWGLLIWGNTLTNVLVENSSVQNNDGLAIGYFGIDFFTNAQSMTNVAVHFNNITGHAIGGGVKNRNSLDASPSDAAHVDAICNWWGDESGPTHSSNPGAIGDAVTDDVSFGPWLAAPAPSGCEVGFVTGGGWFDSPPGSYKVTENSVVTPANLGVDWFLLNQAGGGSIDFVSGPGTPPLGSGSLEMTTTAAPDKATVYNYSHIGTLLADITELSYSTYGNSNTFAPALQMEIDPDGPGTSGIDDYATLNFEPYYNHTVIPGQWQTWDVMTANAGVWGTGLSGNGSIGDPATWDEFITLYPDATIKFGFGTNVGSGWSVPFTGNADGLTIGTGSGVTVYDFESIFPAGPTGKATFGFMSKYKKGAKVPEGNTNFVFKAADLHFQSTEYEWLVVAGEQAKFKGSGTINGAGDYGFMVTAKDDDLLGSSTDDTFRIKIWDKSSDDVIYDNGANIPLGGGNIVIHVPKK